MLKIVNKRINIIATINTVKLREHEPSGVKLTNDIIKNVKQIKYNTSETHKIN